MGMIDLQKKAGIVLAKRNVRSAKARCGLAIDVSGSMQRLYHNGTVQQVVERLLGLAMNLDDDQQLDGWAFDHRVSPLSPARPTDADGYVSRAILNAGEVEKWGATRYAPPLQAALKHWYPKAGFISRMFSRAPASGIQQSLLIFGTDGANDDEAAAWEAMEAAANRPMYVAFIGIGAGPFPFIRQVADALPNVGFLSAQNIGAMTDEDLYEGLVTEELAGWLRTPAATAAA